jgi:hypothetical protein
VSDNRVVRMQFEGKPEEENALVRRTDAADSLPIHCAALTRRVRFDKLTAGIGRCPRWPRDNPGSSRKKAPVANVPFMRPFHSARLRGINDHAASGMLAAGMNAV